jgi:hypothetical protein
MDFEDVLEEMRAAGYGFDPAVVRTALWSSASR